MTLAIVGATLLGGLIGLALAVPLYGFLMFVGVVRGLNW